MKYFLCLWALTFCVSINASTTNSHLTDPDKTGVVSGLIKDAETSELLPYVNIIIKNQNNEILTGGVTNDKGVFKITKIPLGENIIEIQFIGYSTESLRVLFTETNARHDVGTILMNVDANELDEVVVVAEVSTVVQKIDRKVINVGKDLTAAGTTASELLNNVQSVSVDSQTGSVSLRGNENVRVLVDGKPTNISAAQLLQQIPSSSIKQVELITNPSAKYSPEGMSGIINIVLYKSANQGFNGSVNGGVTQGINTSYNGSLDMNYKTGIVNFFMNYGHNSQEGERYGFVNRLDNNSDQNFAGIGDNLSDVLKAGADVYITDKNTFSFYTTQNLSDNVSDGTTKIYDDNVLTIDAFNNAKNDGNSASYNLNYKTDFKKDGHNIEFEATFSNFEGDEYAENGDYLNPSNTFNNYIAEVDNDRNNTLYNIDYANPLGDNSKLELGLEVRTNNVKNSQTTTQYEYHYDENDDLIIRPTPDSNFEYNRDIYSAYASFNHQLNKLTMQLGARFEQYNVDGTFVKGTETEKITDDIFSIYPSAFFTYNPSDKNQFQVSYSRRVDRPSIGQVNPIREWSTPRITQVGNPDLKPQFTDSYEFNYTKQIEKGSFTFGTFYRTVHDNITRILNVDPMDEDKVLMSFTNTDSNDRYGFEGSFNYAITKWWRTNASADLYIQNESGTANGSEIEVTNNAFNARVSNNFKLSDKMRVQMFALYRGGGKSIQFETDPMWMINLGASYNVLKNKGTITFRVNDIFESMQFAFSSQNPYPAVGQFNWESRTAYLGFNYRFGGGKNKAKSRKNRDNNESQNQGGFM